jgi:hypothetical protein
MESVQEEELQPAGIRQRNPDRSHTRSNRNSAASCDSAADTSFVPSVLRKSIPNRRHDEREGDKPNPYQRIAHTIPEKPKRKRESLPLETS